MVAGCQYVGGADDTNELRSRALARAAPPPDRNYVVVKRSAHPGIVLNASELGGRRRRAISSRMAGEAWSRLRRMAAAGSGNALSVRQAAGRTGGHLAQRLEAMALVYHVEQDEAASGSHLPEADRADVEVSCSRIRSVLPVFGSDNIVPVVQPRQ